jgi:hypothetical protein
MALHQPSFSFNAAILRFMFKTSLDCQHEEPNSHHAALVGAISDDAIQGSMGDSWPQWFNKTLGERVPCKISSRDFAMFSFGT